MTGPIILNKGSNYLVLKKYNFKAELGIPFDTKPEPYLNTEKLGADVKKAISENTKVTVDVSKACKGK
ncbi:hypothetical protein DXB93_19650 [Thomasclavelia ramosa]|uniref:Uncharacterized protein n=1 Tax=Thomasclavelia ramosa TaxID=1547 RepID=A0A3E3E097_9FIRM|nr:hypothetical protein DXB93_19650 [Thomasclavelia ramosa]